MTLFPTTRSQPSPPSQTTVGICMMAIIGCLLSANAFAWRDAPEISRSAGRSGEMVVLWTTSVPAPEDPIVISLERALQERLATIASEAAPTVKLDMRPEPERACRQKGCNTISIGATIMYRGDGCSAVAVIAGAGPSDGTVIPWAGRMTLSAPVVGFRAPVEELVTVQDFVPCVRLLEDMDDEAVKKTLELFVQQTPF